MRIYVWHYVAYPSSQTTKHVGEMVRIFPSLTSYSSSSWNAIVLCSRVLPPLWFLLIRMRISRSVVWLKGTIGVCMNLLRIPHGLTKKKDKV